MTTQASGPSITGQPATPAMQFRNGSVAFNYVCTLLMEYVDEHTVSINDTVSRGCAYLPAQKIAIVVAATFLP